jgi:Protein of unknown function (DUF559)
MAFPGTPETFRHRLRRALVNAGPSAVASHRSAAYLFGFEGFDDATIEVVVPRPRKNTVCTGAEVHSSATLRKVDTTTVAGFACTTAARTIVDLAATCSKSELERAIDSAVRSGQVSTAYLTKRLNALRHRGRSGVRLLDDLLVDSGGTNLLERRFLELCRHAALPKPACQVVMKRGGQRVARVDFSFSPHRVIVEVEGQIGHASPTQRNRDAKRRRDLTAMGYEVVSFTHDDVIHHRAETAAYVRAALKRAIASRLIA